MDGVDGDLALLVAINHGAGYHVRSCVALTRPSAHGGLGAGDDQLHLAVLTRRLAGIEHHVHHTDVAYARGAEMPLNARHHMVAVPAITRGVGVHLGLSEMVDDHTVVEAFGEQRRIGRSSGWSRLHSLGLASALG